MCVPAQPFRADETTFFQHFEMLKKRRQRHVERLREIADGGRPGTEGGQHRAPGGVGEGMKRIVEAALLVSHVANYSYVDS